MTTSYPSPVGVYKSLTSTQSTFLARDGGSVGVGTTNPAGMFEVNGAVTLARSGAHRVGIGTTNPSVKFEVVGGAIKATGGLIVETRAADPPNPAVGQIWMALS